MTKEALKLALETLESSRIFVTSREKIKHPEGTDWYDERISAIKEALAQPEFAIGDIRALRHRIHELEGEVIGYKQILDAQPGQEPVAWVYPEGLEALKAGKPWTAYGTRQEPNTTALYLSPQPDIPPYAWGTFTPYGDEDDVWYENPEGQLLEGWTYKPLYDTTPPQRKPLTDEQYEAIVEDLAEWSRYVETDTAHQTLEQHVRQVLAVHRIKE